jgi:hypothetical protein
MLASGHLPLASVRWLLASGHPPPATGIPHPAARRQYPISGMKHTAFHNPNPKPVSRTSHPSTGIPQPAPRNHFCNNPDYLSCNGALVADPQKNSKNL